MTRAARTASRCASATPSAGSLPERKPLGAQADAADAHKFEKPGSDSHDESILYPTDRARAEPRRPADAFQPPLLRRSGYRARLTTGVRLSNHWITSRRGYEYTRHRARHR